MKSLIVRWIVHAVILALGIQGLKAIGYDASIAGVFATILTVFLIALGNALLRPLLHTLLLPLNCLTFGLLGFLFNVLVIWALDGILKEQFNTGGFIGSLILSVMLSFFGAMANKFIVDRKEKD